MNKLKPQCLYKHDKQDHSKTYGHSAKGFILPCCWCDTVNPETDTQLMKLMKEELLLENNNSIEDIIDSPEWNEFYTNITTPENYDKVPKVCKRYCTVNDDGTQKLWKKEFKYGADGKLVK
tara:strand:+ start:94 stop:456 length:363 start_codon:yes stop_codon:yes gene_type:complete